MAEGRIAAVGGDKPSWKDATVTTCTAGAEPGGWLAAQCGGRGERGLGGRRGDWRLCGRQQGGRWAGRGRQEASPVGRATNTV